MTWRWNQWSTLYQRALGHRSSRDSLNDPHRPSPYSYGGGGGGGEEQNDEEKQKEQKARAQERQRKLDHRLQRVLAAETEALRTQFGFEYDDAAGKEL